jgi:hypothetical protein
MMRRVVAIEKNRLLKSDEGRCGERERQHATFRC